MATVTIPSNAPPIAILIFGVFLIFLGVYVEPGTNLIVIGIILIIVGFVMGIIEAIKPDFFGRKKNL